ncbi:hypothetical protein CHARACLAT_032042 [Characodon lateralis]|uniref:Uncharacterized protein n=1 Tax=Characodon lateralis TaxID=208331 RepID=A0ABU7ESE4_9TELE|nr:hypothetical protein [Characodon lateralis]
MQPSGSHTIGRRFMQPSGSIAIGRRFMQPSGSIAIGRRFMKPSGSIAIGRRFIKPSGSHTPLAGIYKHALASISILSLVRHSSNHLDTARCSPSSPDLASAIHSSSVITQV